MDWNADSVGSGILNAGGAEAAPGSFGFLECGALDQDWIKYPFYYDLCDSVTFVYREGFGAMVNQYHLHIPCKVAVQNPSVCAYAKPGCQARSGSDAPV